MMSYMCSWLTWHEPWSSAPQWGTLNPSLMSIMVGFSLFSVWINGVNAVPLEKGEECVIRQVNKNYNTIWVCKGILIGCLCISCGCISLKMWSVSRPPNILHTFAFTFGGSFEKASSTSLWQRVQCLSFRVLSGATSSKIKRHKLYNKAGLHNWQSVFTICSCIPSSHNL